MADERRFRMVCADCRQQKVWHAWLGIWTCTNRSCHRAIIIAGSRGNSATTR